jgi:hypothetical protein
MNSNQTFKKSFFFLYISRKKGKEERKDEFFQNNIKKLKTKPAEPAKPNPQSNSRQ